MCATNERTMSGWRESGHQRAPKEGNACGVEMATMMPVYAATSKPTRPTWAGKGHEGVHLPVEHRLMNPAAVNSVSSQTQLEERSLERSWAQALRLIPPARSLRLRRSSSSWAMAMLTAHALNSGLACASSASIVSRLAAAPAKCMGMNTTPGLVLGDTLTATHRPAPRRHPNHVARVPPHRAASTSAVPHACGYSSSMRVARHRAAVPVLQQTARGQNERAFVVHRLGYRDVFERKTAAPGREALGE